MRQHSNISIKLEYMLLDSNIWASVTLLPEEYFDLDPDEEITLDCVPKYNHAIDYLDCDKVCNTRLEISDLSTKATRGITETFWNDGKNRIIERIDKGSGLDYNEMILEITVSESPLTWEIVRLHRQDGLLIPNYHGYITKNADGSETEIKVSLV